MADELTRQQMNKIMAFVDTAMMRQKFGAEKGDMKETGLKSLAELETHLKDMNDISGKMVRGLRDLLKWPKTINQVYRDIQTAVHDSSSNYADSINKMSKVNLESIRIHGANSEAIKNQTKGILKSVHALSDFKENAKKYNEITALIAKTADRKDELERKPTTTATPAEKAELAHLKNAEAAQQQFENDIKKQITELKEALFNSGSMTAEMQGEFSSHLKALIEIEDTIKSGNELAENDFKVAEEILEVSKAQLQVTTAANNHFKEHLKEAQAQGKAMALAIGAMAIAVGKRVAESLYSQLGANLGGTVAGSHTQMAYNLGMSPEDLYGVAKTNATQLQLFSGGKSTNESLESENLRQLQLSTRALGLTGAEALKAALKNIDSQLYMGTYRKEHTEQQRVAAATRMSNKFSEAGSMLQESGTDFAADFNDKLESGLLNSEIMELSKDKNLSQKDLSDALIDNVKMQRLSVRQLGLNNEYHKQMLQEGIRARHQGLEQFIRGQIGVSAGKSLTNSFLGINISPEQSLALSKSEALGGDLTKLTDTEMAMVVNLQADIDKKQTEIQNELAAATSQDEIQKVMSKQLMFNTMRQQLPSITFSDEKIIQAGAARIRAKTIDAATVRDALTKKIISTPIAQMDEAANKSTTAVSSFTGALLEAVEKIRGAFASPIGSVVGSALGWAGAAGASGFGGYVGGKWAARGLGVTTPAGPTPPSGGRFANLFKGKKGKAIIGTAILAGLLYGVDSYASDGGSGGSGGSGGGPTIGPNGEMIDGTFSIENATLNITNSNGGTGGNGGNGGSNISPEMLEKAAAYGGTALVGGGVLYDIMKTLQTTTAVGAAQKGLAVGGNLLKSSGIWTAIASLGEAGYVGYNTGSDEYGKYFQMETGSVLSDLLVRSIGFQHDLRAIAVRNLSFGIIDAKTVAERMAEDPNANIGSDTKGLIDTYTNNDEPPDLYPWMPKIRKPLEFVDHSKPLQESDILKFIDKEKDDRLAVLAAKEEKMADIQKNVEEERSKLDPSAIEFMEKIVGFFETITRIGTSIAGVNKQEVLDKRTQQQIDKDAAASAQGRVDAGVARVTDTVTRAVAKTKASVWG